MTPTAPCPSCASENQAGSRFCSSCGQRIDVFSRAPTMAVRPEPAPRVARLISSDSIPAGGFAPGVILVDRYRIIGLLGRGGMGEVYRADDLKLGQAVALKFLPQALADDPVRRERFFAEVRIARQLSHPNVCRVYDIAEYEGRHFLSMEYIDGEDLASLLQRIGHLSNEKAVDIARQLAAGLSAAHERGVLHRDLKPSNVMLDGLGRVRITDFGLAVAADDESQATEVSGTPAYMAPEQLSGKGATIRSDIYSLGLILYEIYTGKRAFKASTIADLREQKAAHTPTAPSDLRSGVDPVVERLIMRCLEREPSMRPSSVAQVAAALPGGDALAAAIAAGETPAPDLLITAGPKEGLRPVVALCLLVFVVVGGLAAALMSDRVGLVQRAKLTKPPDALIDDARELLRKVGYTQTAVDDASGFFTDGDALRWVTECYFSFSCRPGTIEHLEAAGVVGFFHRQSPRPLLGVGPLGGIGPDDPAMQFPGEVAVLLDGQGRLRAFLAVPPREESDAASSTVDWSALFSEAGLDIAQWKPVDPGWTPPFYADTRMAWIGALPDAASVQVRIEAAAYRGRPVSFVIVGPWTLPVPVRGFAAGAQTPLPRVIAGMTFLYVVFGTAGAYVARRNLRLGRGDRRGATRVMLFTLGCWFVSWIAIEHHVADLGEALLVAGFAGMFLPLAGLLWVFYIAVEPFVRRRWPRLLVSWTRLLAGDWRDPVVGRDVLIGSAAGIASLDLVYGAMLSPLALGRSPGLFSTINWNLFNGPLSLLGTLLFVTSIAIAQGLLALLMLLVLRVVLRRDWAAAIVLGAVSYFGAPFLMEPLWLTVMLRVAFAVVSVFVLFRVGLLASVVLFFLMFLQMNASITIQPSAWYAGISYAVLLFLAGIALYGFRTALGGRPMMGTLAIED